MLCPADKHPSQAGELYFILMRAAQIVAQQRIGFGGLGFCFRECKFLWGKLKPFFFLSLIILFRDLIDIQCQFPKTEVRNVTWIKTHEFRY